MIYPYTVVKDGVWYPSGTEVPDGKHQYTKTEINKMPLADLRNLGEILNVEMVESKTGAEIKKEIIRKLNL